MSLQRKQIVLNEIAFWKKNKLLPEHYCDFLTALYAQGESGAIDKNEKASTAILGQEKKRKMSLFILLGLATVILFVSLLMVTTVVVIPITISGFAVFVFLYIATKLAKSKSVMTPVLFVFSALLLLGVSFKVWNTYFMEHPSILIGLIIANCVLWLFSGLLMRLIYFTISGLVGIGFILVYAIWFYS